MKHRLLLRQLRALELEENLPPTKKMWDEFLNKIEKAYNDFDQERYLMERSLVISSKEMQGRWEELQEQKALSIQNSKMATLGEMAGGIAHEINTPLATISMLLQQLQELEGIADNSKTKMDATVLNIDQAIKRISKIVSGLLAFSRHSDNESLSLVSVQSILDNTLNLCQEKFKTNGICIEVNCDEALSVLCRPIQLTQVLLSLLNNSYDAVLKTQDPWIRIVCKKQDGHIVVSIIDSGKGIPAEIAERMMEPFYTTKSLGQGTGLGLSVSKGVIESLGGTIEIDRKHANTCFVITLALPSSEISRKAV